MLDIDLDEFQGMCIIMYILSIRIRIILVWEW